MINKTTQAKTLIFNKLKNIKKLNIQCYVISIKLFTYICMTFYFHYKKMIILRNKV